MRHTILALALICLPICNAATLPLQQSDSFDTEAGSLIAVLRESAGSNQDRETLQPYGTVHVQLPDGGEAELETSWFRYVGDMHIRLVFDSKAHLQGASPDDLDRLRLDPQQAVQLAVANLRRTYGEPEVQPWRGGLMRVLGRADDLNSSYFLDRAFDGASVADAVAGAAEAQHGTARGHFLQRDTRGDFAPLVVDLSIDDQHPLGRVRRIDAARDDQ